jgi:hypothetical protein
LPSPYCRTDDATQPGSLLVAVMSRLTSFTGATNSFVKLDERSVYNSLTAAVHERMVSATANYGHDANADTTDQWLVCTR